MTAREELAAVLEDYLALYALPANYAHTYTGERHRDVARRCAPLATDALLASPALARVIREREFEAIKAANLRTIKHEIDTPSRGHGGCCGDQTVEPT